MLIAPAHLRDGILAEIERTIEAHREGRHARIAMKMNSLVDRRCIRALYEASQAGVPVDLNIRGICCLRPGVPGVSENIRVVSIVGRFLEHSRIYAFERGDTRTVYIGSADLMPRNLDTRVELLAPVRDDALRADLLDTLERCFADDTNAWELGQDGTWTRRTPDGPEPRNVQRELMTGHAARAPERRRRRRPLERDRSPLPFQPARASSSARGTSLEESTQVWPRRRQVTTSRPDARSARIDGALDGGPVGRVGLVERGAGDDGVGDPLAVLLVEDGAGGAALDLVRAGADGLPAELADVVGEADVGRRAP